MNWRMRTFTLLVLMAVAPLSFSFADTSAGCWEVKKNPDPTKVKQKICLEKLETLSKPFEMQISITSDAFDQTVKLNKLATLSDGFTAQADEVSFTEFEHGGDGIVTTTFQLIVSLNLKGEYVRTLSVKSSVSYTPDWMHRSSKKLYDVEYFPEYKSYDNTCLTIGSGPALSFNLIQHEGRVWVEVSQEVKTIYGNIPAGFYIAEPNSGLSNKEVSVNVDSFIQGEIGCDSLYDARLNFRVNASGKSEIELGASIHGSGGYEEIYTSPTSCYR